MKAVANQIGTNCWSPKRFCGGRCDRVFRCNYPDKKTCKAVASEVAYIEQNSATRIAKIEQVAKRAIEQLGGKNNG